MSHGAGVGARTANSVSLTAVFRLCICFQFSDVEHSF